MKVFVGFGYNDNDKWIKDLIIPFIEELGCEVITGEEMHGEILSEGVISRIKNCDACIGFLTKRGQPNNDGIYTTHWWVISELSNALSFNVPLFEIREKGVESQQGETGDRQRYEFDDKSLLMLELTKFVMKQKTQLAYKIFMLLPQEFSDSVKPYVKYAKCMYRFLHRARYYEPEDTELLRMQGGYGIIIKKIPHEEAQVEITIELPGNICWTSGFVSVGLMNINLQKDN